MKWFVAKVCYQIVTQDRHAQDQFDEQFRLVFAGSEEEAFRKAELLGLTEEERFLNRDGLPVHWKWVGVTELSEVKKLYDGAELFSGITEAERSAGYLNQLLTRTQILKSRLAQPVQLCAAG